MKCIILAGGSGERLWPLSRDSYPKSLLKIDGDKTLIQNVYEIASLITSTKNIITVTNIKQEFEIKSQLKELCKKPIVISEPMIKNTAAAVASSLKFIETDKDEIVVVLPVDFYIEDKQAFVNAIKKAQAIAKQEYICILGVKPEYHDNGFGYIKAGKAFKDGFLVSNFIEKPTKEEAASFIKKNYYWNTGIYIGLRSIFDECYKNYAPQIVQNFSKNMFDDNNRIYYAYYEKIPEISIDYALTEKIKNLAFVELETKWNDLGSWKNIYNKKDKDSNNNVITGNVIANKVKNSLVYSSKELVALSGIKNKIVIETEDAVLVCEKDRAGDIGKIVKDLKKKQNSTAITNKTVFRPWGYYTCLNEGKGWLTKLIFVTPKNKLSLQSHEHRSEHWVVLEGSAVVILNDEKHILNKGCSIDIPIKAKHSLQNNTNNPLKILEVQKGDYISEDDIIRYEDIYGRDVQPQDKSVK